MGYTKIIAAPSSTPPSSTPPSSTPPVPTPPVPTPPTRRPTTPVPVVRVRGHEVRERPDVLTTEEPLEIRVVEPGAPPMSIAVTMRTPTADFDLAVGFLFTAGLIQPNDVHTVRYCDLPSEAEQQYNIVTVALVRSLRREVPARSFPVNSSCGLCGATSLDALEARCGSVLQGPAVAGTVVAGLPAELRTRQRLFDATGGLHGAALFDSEGTCLVVREDVGRHNAVDKVIGWALLGGRVPLTGHLLGVSGRVSFEIVEKAAMAGVGLIAAVSAPSSLAVDAASRLGVTLAGFVREGGYNLYSHAGRVDTDR